MNSLLTIDVAAELRKLAHGPLEGPWQVPADLVRCCLALGARSVDVRLGAEGFRLQAAGGVLAAEVLGRLGVLLDATRDAGERHQALVDVESEGMADLLGLLALDATRLSIESGGWRLQAAPARGAAKEWPLSPSNPGGTAWRLERTGFVEGVRVDIAAHVDADRAVEWLGAVARFAPVPVRLEGRSLGVGFGPTLAEAPLAPPLSGRLALAPGSDAARVWLLLDGIVAAHLVLPGQPPFLAVAELGASRPTPVGTRSAAALREAIEPHLGDLVAQAVDLALQLVPTLSRRTAEEQRLLRRVLLMAALRRVRTERVLAAPALPARRGSAHDWLSLLDLEAGGRGEAVWVVSPGASAGDFLLPSEPVFRLTEEERGLVRQLIDVSFRTPPRQPSTPRLARGREALAARLDRLADAWARLTRKQPLAEAALSWEERALAAAVAGFTDMAFCKGAGRSRRVGGRWLVPRDGRIARAAARAVAADPAWAYPAALALLGGRALPAPEAADRWRAARGPASAKAR